MSVRALTSFMQSLVAVARCSRLCLARRFHGVSWLSKAEIRPPWLLRSKRKLCDNENHVICQQTCLLLSYTHIQTRRHTYTHKRGQTVVGLAAMINEVGKCGADGEQKLTVAPCVWGFQQRFSDVWRLGIRKKNINEKEMSGAVADSGF